MLRQRVITAIGIVAVLALLLFVLPPAFAVVGIALLALAGAWEWSSLAGFESLPPASVISRPARRRWPGSGWQRLNRRLSRPPCS